VIGFKMNPLFLRLSNWSHSKPSRSFDVAEDAPFALY
jgi:hypothetical protein